MFFDYVFHGGFFFRVDDNNERKRKWQCSDTEIQLHVLRAMVNFIGCVSPHVLQLSILKVFAVLNLV